MLAEKIDKPLAVGMYFLFSWSSRSIHQMDPWAQPKKEKRKKNETKKSTNSKPKSLPPLQKNRKKKKTRLLPNLIQISLSISQSSLGLSDLSSKGGPSLIGPLLGSLKGDFGLAEGEGVLGKVSVELDLGLVAGDNT